MTNLPSPENVSIYKNLFKGRTDVFAVRWERADKSASGYMPVCLNEWKYGKWVDGVWFNGTWYNCVFESGIIFNGTFLKGSFLAGTFRKKNQNSTDTKRDFIECEISNAFKEV